MLVRISLIIAILAGLAVGGLNFVKVKEKVTTLQVDFKRESDAHQKFEADYRSTKNMLDKTNAVLKQTQTTLAATTEERDKAQTDLKQTKTTLATTTTERDKARQER